MIYRKTTILYLFLTLQILIISCTDKDINEQGYASFSLASPQNGSTHKHGDLISIAINQTPLGPFDSVKILLDSQKVFVTKSLPIDYVWETEKSLLGEHLIKVVIYRQGLIEGMDNVIVTLLSDVKPTLYKYSIIKSYSHDTDAFTEGLIFSDGLIYESTGIQGSSSLRKVDLESGQVLDKIMLDDQYFGEGITNLNDQIFQLIWKSKKALTYDVANFSLKGEINCPLEGWGITNDGTRLITSNGTSSIFFLNVNSLKIERRIEVYDDKGPVNNLNELEFIEGEIFANVWKTDFIVRIDPETGKVLGWIDLKGILNMELPKENVLNGIAYDKAQDRLFVTGKNWPSLFHIDLVKQ